MPVDDKIASEQWYRFRWCLERGHYDFLDKAQRCEDFYAGNQWAPEDLAKLRNQQRPAMTVNKILSTLNTVAGEQISQRNEILFRPSAGASSEVADALTKVWMHIAQKNQLPWVRSDVFLDGLIRSRGFLDVRMKFLDNMQGEVSITPLNSKNVVIDPDAEEYDPDDWNDIFITKWMTYQDIAALYSKEDAEYLRDREMSMFPYAYDSIERVRDRFAGVALQGSYYGVTDTAGVRRNIRVVERQYHVLTLRKYFVVVQTGDSRAVPDGWQRDRIAQVVEQAQGQVAVVSKQEKRIKWTVTADNAVLHDDWSPYKHFTPVPYFPVFRYGRTLGMAEGLIGPQEILNKTLSQELHIVNTTANSGWKIKTGSLKNMEIEQLRAAGAQSGLILELDDVNAAEKILPNQTPNGLDRVSYKAEEHIKSISGVSDSMQGFDREDVAAKAIAYKQQRGSVNLAKVMDNLERTDYILARNVLDLVQEFYTEPRLIRITHDDVGHEAEEVSVNEPQPDGTIVNDLTLGEYSIVITSTPARASMEDSQFEQALALRKEGIQIPDNVIVESSRLPRRAEIVKMMKAQSESPQAKEAAALAQRAQVAAVEKLEAETQSIMSKAALEKAKAQHIDTQTTGQAAENAQTLLSAQQAEPGPDTGPDTARMEMEHKHKLAEEDQAHRHTLAQREYEHKRDLALRDQQTKNEVEHYTARARAQTQAPAPAPAPAPAEEAAEEAAEAPAHSPVAPPSDEEGAGSSERARNTSTE